MPIDTMSSQPCIKPKLGAGCHYSILICCLLSFHTVSMYISFLFEMPRMLLHFCGIDRIIVDKTNKGNIFCRCILLVLQSYRTPHLYIPAYLARCTNNWEYIIAWDSQSSGWATVAKVCNKRNDCNSKAHTCADEAHNIYPSNVCPGGATYHC